MVKYIALYLIIINIITFAVFGIDKRKAIKHKWRVPEATLFILSIIGGSLGGIFGMYIFHHKTKKIYFLIGIPLIFVLQTTLAVYLYIKF